MYTGVADVSLIESVINIHTFSADHRKRLNIIDVRFFAFSGMKKAGRMSRRSLVALRSHRDVDGFIFLSEFASSTWSTSECYFQPVALDQPRSFVHSTGSCWWFPSVISLIAVCVGIFQSMCVAAHRYPTQSHARLAKNSSAWISDGANWSSSHTQTNAFIGKCYKLKRFMGLPKDGIVNVLYVQERICWRFSFRSTLGWQSLLSLHQGVCTIGWSGLTVRNYLGVVGWPVTFQVL